MSGGDALKMAQEIYEKAYGRADELCKPYAAVIDIDRAKLPEPKTVRNWSGDQLAAALRHDQKNPAYNVSLRQLVHVGFKVAAELGDAYYQALERHADTIGRLVTENLLEKHIKRVFLAA